MANTVAEIVTQRFIEELEKGTIPWQKPWSGGNRWAISHSTGKPYMFINQMILDGGEYLTFDECRKEGGKVKKGEKGSFCLSWAKIKQTSKITNDDGEVEEITKTVPRLRYYYVFEVSQCEGIERKYTDDSKTYNTEHIANADEVIKAYLDRENSLNFEELEGSARAYYSPAEDKVVVPAIINFERVEEFYSTAFHELTHSTMHASRCNRQEERKGKNVAFGSEEYSKEELVAEIGAASLVNICGLETTHSFRNSAAYIQSWLKALKNDSNLIVGACARAEKAVSYILNQ